MASGAPLRRSSRKRVYVVGASDIDATEVETEDEPRPIVAGKRRAVANPKTGAPMQKPSDRRSAARVRDHSASVERSFIPTPTIPKSNSTPTYEDLVPADCCYRCRNRGGNAAYHCVYESDSDACNLCIKERAKCRPATAEELAKSEARCPQCKQRGYTHCSGTPNCDTCARRGIQCNAPTKRKINTRTHSSLGPATPESERLAKATASPSTTAHVDIPDAHPRTNLPLQTRRSTRRSAAISSSDVMSDFDSAKTIFDLTTVSAASQQPKRHVSAVTRSRISHVPSIADNCEMLAIHDTASLKPQSSRVSSKWSKESTSLETMQQATPEDSADDGSMLFSTDIDMDHEESASFQLMTENHQARSLSSMKTEAGAQNSKELPTYVDSYGERLISDRNRVAVLIPPLSRPRRSQGRPSYIEKAMSDTSAEGSRHGSSETDDDVCDPSATEIETDKDEESGLLFSGSSDNENSEDSGPNDLEQEPLLASRQRSRSHKHANTHKHVNTQRPTQHTSKRQITTTMSDDNPTAYKGDVLPGQPNYIRWKRELIVQADTEGATALFHKPNSDETEYILNEPFMPPRKEKDTNSAQSEATPKQGKGINSDLPPLDDIREIVADMATRAVEIGLGDVLRKLDGQPINVATMCSGTESPLLFLQMLDEALQSEGKGSLPVKHHFSAEIDATKQAYIERNFQPRILFRDVRELGVENATTATTAYGAEEPIPGNLDILVAGFVCKDLSSLNSNKKTVDDQGETGDTWRAIYYYAKHFQPGIVLLENVKSRDATWKDVVSKWSEIGYKADYMYCDSKAYYIPQTRERMYMIAINHNKYGGNASTVVAAWKSTMNKLKRQCSSHYESFLAKVPAAIASHSALSSESNWALCKLRFDQIRSEESLGTRRPITQWDESGTLNPPDYANRKWYNSQSSRVYDAIDVAHLQAAKEGHDSMYKMKIWDVSQNVDRFKTGLGIVPCITPGGCHFASNRQDALNGSQTLVLQGMPLDKLHFAGETQRECQDLAGNAMTTTVIGASLISAIMHGYKVFRKDPLAGNQDASSWMSSTTKDRLVQVSTMEKYEHRQPAPNSLNVAQLLAEANLTSRKCACEGDQHISEAYIKTCSGCGHTACATCASNPRHQYTEGAKHSSRGQSPGEFIKAWRPQVPSRLSLANISGLDEVLKSDEPYAQRILKVGIGSQHFCLSEFVRCDNEWRIVYVGNDARLVLSVGGKAQWLLYVDCLRESPGNSELRKVLETPIAHANINDSLLGATWEIFSPSMEKYLLQFRESTGRYKSWRNSLGLLDYQDQTVPTNIHVQGPSEDIDVQGDYTYLPQCGTAEASLYKRSTKPALYLFLDPNLIGDSRDDGFVFSRDCRKKQLGESRTIVARLDSTWRPWQKKSNEQYTTTAVRTGYWKMIEMELADSSLSPVARILEPRTKLTSSEVQCTTALTILDAQISEKLPVGQFSDYSWALEKVRTAPQLEQWQQLDIQSQDDCSCSPAYPKLQWSVDNRGKAIPLEDRKSAATFERGIKSRRPIFDVQTEDDKDMTRIKVGISLASLAHRAKGRLRRFMNSNGSINSSWRLLTDHVDTSSARFPTFHLSSNATNALYAGPLTLEEPLVGLQPRAVTWMRAQESGVQLEVTEIEEAIHPGLGWRAEASAQTVTEIQGGVLADQPSFGKTVTTIALIQSEFEEHSPEDILCQNQSAAKKLPQLFDTAATLIVCPPIIAKQWQTELKKFLSRQQYDAYKVCIVTDLAGLKKLTILDIQQSRVVIVSWSVLSANDYISELAYTTAMPEPADSNGRAFSAWLEAVGEHLPAQISKLQTGDIPHFWQTTQDLLEQRLQQPEFGAILPLKLQHGSNYQPYKSTRGAGQKKSRNSQPTPKRNISESRTSIIPLIHLFRFNRVVVDEYHYLNEHRNKNAAISVKKISAHKRWILSGTPALANFTDIDNIASFLGVRLGRFAVGAGKRTALDESILNDQTAVERFLSKTEVMSHQWHQARHQRAQKFLNLFVRQNEASLEHIPCQQEVRAVDLDIAHHAVYLELSQHLISQRMQVKRLRNKADSDRTSRLNTSLNNSKTAEDALLKAALDYKTSTEESGLEALVQKRSRQCHETEAEIERLMRAFEWHKATGFKDLKPTDPSKAEAEDNTVPKLYTSFAKDVLENAWLGDAEAATKVGQLLKAARKHPSKKGLEELRGVSKDRMVKESKTALSHLRQSCVELALRFRSQRFVRKVKELLVPLCNESHGPIQCDAQNCPRADVKEMYLVSQCGHLTCGRCMLARGGDENCVAEGCGCTVQIIDFIKATDLGSKREDEATQRFGQKTTSIIRLIMGFEDEQGLVFAPNDETIAVLCAVFDHYDVSYCTPSGRNAADVVEKFKASAEDVKNRPNILLLNLASETAAGINLTNANHIIFVSPLLVESQHRYDSAMTQAIARSRRYGQEKKVHIYHFAALRTIDIDILEHRHKRKDGITSAGSRMLMPQEALKLREKTRLVRNKYGDVALVPASWLDSAEVRENLGVEEELEKFTSLINFSETFQDVEE